MAKALLGHIGGTDLRMIAEVQRLRQRVKELETQIVRLQVENDALGAAIHREDLISLEAEHSEHALVGSSA